MANGIGRGFGQAAGRGFKAVGKSIQDVLREQFVGPVDPNLQMNQIGSETVLNTLLNIGGMGSMIPEAAKDEGKKVLKDIYRGFAEEIAGKPGGIQLLEEAVASPEERALQQQEQATEEQKVGGGGAPTADALSLGLAGQAEDAIRRQSQMTGAGSTASGAPPKLITDEELAAQAQPQDAAAQARVPQILPAKGLFTKQMITPEGDIQLGGPMDIFGTPLPQLLQAQKLIGQEPLQAGTRELTELTANLEAINTAYEKGIASISKLSGEQAKNLGSANVGIDMIDGLLGAFEKNPNMFSFNFATTEAAQKTRASLINLQDILGRMRSGGAINEEELRTFKKLLPTTGVVKGRIEKPGTVQFKLMTLRQILNDVKQGIRPDLTESNFIVNAINAGAQPSEINRFLAAKRRGRP